MNRRKLLAVFAGFASLAGCARNENEEFEPNISETVRLGTANPITLDQEVTISNRNTHDFEAEATKKANIRVHDYIGSILREQELLGAGVFLGIDYISTTEIDDEVEEDEFERAKPLATVVNQRYIYDADGELITQPKPRELDTLLSQLPRTVTVSVSSDTARYLAVLPVVVRRYWVQQNTVAN